MITDLILVGFIIIMFCIPLFILKSVYEMNKSK